MQGMFLRLAVCTIASWALLAEQAEAQFASENVALLSNIPLNGFPGSPGGRK